MFLQTCLGVEDIKSLLCLIEQLSVAFLSARLTLEINILQLTLPQLSFE